MISASHGSWTSPIDVELVSAPSAARPSEPQLDRGVAYWLEARPSEGGRVTLCREGGADLTPGFNVRSRVHEYGGGAYHVNRGVTVFNDLISGRVHRWEADGPVPITPENPAWRYADLRVHPARGLVLAVREDHSAPGEAVNSIVALSLEGPNTDGGTPLCLGADFYASPELSDDGRLAWVEWNHPNMPWDATLLRVALLTQGAAGPLLAEPTTVAGAPRKPRDSPSGARTAPSSTSRIGTAGRSPIEPATRTRWSTTMPTPCHRCGSSGSGPGWSRRIAASTTPPGNTWAVSPPGGHGWSSSRAAPINPPPSWRWTWKRADESPWPAGEP
ncbi:MAG: hypothetical protein IPL43_00665 [Micropruina sp.]|nr:hypothetical protein [Micropruina sp.]